MIEGRFYLFAPVSAPTLDALATFEAEGEDLEDGGDHELNNEDGDDSDLEPSIGNASGFIGDDDLEEDTSDFEDGHDDEYDYRHLP